MVTSFIFMTSTGAIITAGILIHRCHHLVILLQSQCSWFLNYCTLSQNRIYRFHSDSIIISLDSCIWSGWLFNFISVGQIDDSNIFFCVYNIHCMHIIWKRNPLPCPSFLSPHTLDLIVLKKQNLVLVARNEKISIFFIHNYILFIFLDNQCIHY